MFETWQLEFSICRIRVRGFVAKLGSDCKLSKKKGAPHHANFAYKDMETCIWNASLLSQWFPAFVGSPRKGSRTHNFGPETLVLNFWTPDS